MPARGAVRDARAQAADNRVVSARIRIPMIRCCLLLLAALLAPAVHAQRGIDTLVIDAQQAWQKKDRSRLADLRDTLVNARHPLASWADYWALNARLGEATPDQVAEFYARWPGTYVEDRLRNDWLLELGRRSDWDNLTADFPRFRMNDDREVTCYVRLAEHRAGQAVREAALAAWLAQRDVDDGCQLLATRLVEARVFGHDEIWRKVRAAVEAGRTRAARAAAQLLEPAVASAAVEAIEQPVRFLARRNGAQSRHERELAAVALARWAASDTDTAAESLKRWQRLLPPDLAAWATAQLARQQALKLSPEAAATYREAWTLADRVEAGARQAPWGSDTLGWSVRAALRSSHPQRWRLVLKAIDDLPEAEQRDNAWAYWQARALRETAADGAAGDAQRERAAAQLAALAATPLDFYAKLAAEDLGRGFTLPTAAAPPTPAERDAALKHPGLTRALQLIALGLRSEGVREWNFSLRGMGDRELLAAAALACEREVWDRCINTSDRTRTEFALDQRYPMPFKPQVVAQAREIGLDPAYVYGLIRQESRFILDARSHVGASGLMQLMPATARWTARKIGLAFTSDMVTDREVNLKLGTAYLKLVLDDFGGSQALAAAGYNAGPSRPRRWREGAHLEAAIWAENIPFTETRDYVKKVLSNAVIYGALLGNEKPSLKARLGTRIGPAPPDAVADKDLP
jgi:soluble lytic murein transglycosylase